MALAITCGLLSACASGDGGNSSNGISGGNNVSGNAGTANILPVAAYPVANATGATKGGNATPDMFAAGADFRAPLPGTAFPLTETALHQSPSGVTEQGAVNGAGATLTVLDGASGRLRLSIPSLGISTDMNGPGSAVAGGRDIRLGFATLQHVAFGEWSVQDSENATFGHFIAGYQTLAAGMPATGTASYDGKASGEIFLPDKSRAVLEGDASVAVSFSLGSASGKLTNMVARQGNAATAWNDVFLFANFGADGTLLGITRIASTPATPFALGTGAEGTVTGHFYGPRADELGAVWSIGAATGVLAGKIGPLLYDPCFGCWDY